MGPAWNNYAPIAREGLKYIFASLVLLVLAWIFFDHLWIQLVCVGMFAGTSFFFRNPERLVPLDLNGVVSPADGKVMMAETLPRKEDGIQRQKIAIFLSVFDVHINRAPISGTVKQVTYRPGGFSMAFRPKESEENEQNEIVLEDDKGRRVTVTQIAGFIARRIVCYLKKDHFIQTGDRFGLIEFGSRVNIIIEGNVDVHVKPGDRVVGGETLLAHFRE